MPGTVTLVTEVPACVNNSDDYIMDWITVHSNTSQPGCLVMVNTAFKQQYFHPGETYKIMALQCISLLNLNLTNTAAAALIKITNVVDSNVVLPGSHKLHSATRYIRVTAAVWPPSAPGHFQISDLTRGSGFGGYGEEYKVHTSQCPDQQQCSGAQLGADVSSPSPPELR